MVGRGGPARERAVAVGSCPTLVEREAQLAQLGRIADRTEVGASHLVVVTGEAGTGKSRLVREFAASLDEGWQRSFVRIGTSPFVLDVPAEVAAGAAPAGAIGAALGRALAARAADGPFAIAIDDLERADPAVIGALGAALDVVHADPVLVLATFRLGAHRARNDATAALADVLRAAAAHEIRLESLSRDGVERMARAMGHELTDSELDRLHARAGGNPFFVEELLETPSERLPWTITEAVVERLDALPPPARDAARALACARDPIPRELIERIVADGAEGIAALVDTGIAIPVPDDDVSLRHALMSEVIEAQLAAQDRREWHRRLADALERRGDAPPARLSRHWTAAGDAQRAARCAVIAADDATRGRAYRTATELYRVALRCPPDGDLEQAELFDRAAVAAGWAGLERQAFEWACVADARYREAGEKWRAGTMWLNPVLTHVPKPPIDHRELADDAIPRLLGEARDLTRQRQLDAAVELAHRVLAMCDQTSDLGATWMADAANRLIGAGRLVEGEEILHRVRAAAATAGNQQVEVRMLGALATLAASRGELDDCVTFNRRAIAIARGLDHGAWPYEVGTALVLAYIGALDEAAAMVDELLARDDPIVVEFTQLPACVVDLERGELDDARARLERLQAVHSLGVPTFIMGVLIARARWQFLSGDHARVLETVTQANDVTGDLFEPSRLEVLVLAVRAASVVGDDATVDAAIAALDELVQLGGGRGIRAAAAWADGIRRARTGGFDEAISRLATGAEQFERAGRAVHAAEAWLDMASVAGQRGVRRARDLATARARGIAEARGLHSVRARLEQLSADAPDDADPLQVLSARERQIAQLVVEGRTNRQIASALFVSEHTVRNQLVSIFAKLGISRRTELARLAAHE